MPQDLCGYPSWVVGLCASAHAQCAPSFPRPIRITVGIARPSNPPPRHPFVASRWLGLPVLTFVRTGRDWPPHSLGPSELRLRQIDNPVLAIARTGRDSNPRLAFTNTRFPGVPDRPLRHLSLNRKEYPKRLSFEASNPAARKGRLSQPTMLREERRSLNCPHGRMATCIPTKTKTHRFFNFNLNFN